RPGLLVPSGEVTPRRAATPLATTPPEPISASSGCAKITIARSGTAVTTSSFSSATVPPCSADWLRHQQLGAGFRTVASLLAHPARLLGGRNGPGSYDDVPRAGTGAPATR